MTAPRAVTVTLSGIIDHRTARDAAARVRAAIQNDAAEVRVAFEDGAEIRSAEFLGFMAASARHLADADRRLVVRAADSSVRGAFAISRLDRTLDVREAVS